MVPVGVVPFITYPLFSALPCAVIRCAVRPDSSHKVGVKIYVPREARRSGGYRWNGLQHSEYL